MNILHLLSQNHLTGAEVYAVQLIHEQSRSNTVFQISNDFFVSSEATKIKLAVETKSKIKFYKNVMWLRRFLVEKNIHVIHTHSRAAAKMAYWARKGLKVGLVSTVHGRQPSSLSKKLMNQYGDFVISVCESIQAQLQRDFNFKNRRLSVVRNPVSENAFQFLNSTDSYSKEKKIKIAIIGRTTGPKGDRTRLILNELPSLQKEFNFQADLVLVGASNAAITLGLNEDVALTQVQVNSLTSADYAKYDLVIGSGRVAIESILTGIPTICFGEASYLGLARINTIKSFVASNFGDIEVDSIAPVLNKEQLKTDLRDFFSNTFLNDERKKMSEFIQNEFNSKKIARHIFSIYESSYFLRNYCKWIPILMYHKIPDQEIQSQHKIFVTKDRFQAHLQFFKDHGFETVTFSQLKKFKSGLADFSTFPKKPLILTFDDGYVDNLMTASPLLKQFGFRAQIFLLANSEIDSNRWDHSPTEVSHPIVSGKDRQKWKDSAFEIGSHGFSHKKITSMTDEEARAELRNSKLSLEKEFQTEICSYAFTYGDTSAKYAEFALEEGYDYAVNTDTGGLLLEEDPYQIFRVNIFPNETTSSLRKKTSTWYRRYYYWKRKQ